MGGMQGLDYVSVKAVLDLLELENKIEIFKNIRFIEIGVLNELKNDK